jgi:hypothetical protein
MVQGGVTAFEMPPPTAGCAEWDLHLSDLGDDGWNGITLNVYNCHGDVVLSDITLSDGSEGTVDVCLEPALGYRFVTDGPSDDIEWSLSDQSGSVLIAGGAPFDGYWGECPCTANLGDWRLNLLGSKWNVSTCDMQEVSNGATHWAVAFAHDVCLPGTGGNTSAQDAEHHYVIDSQGGDYLTHWQLRTQAGDALLSGDVGVVSICGSCMSSDGTPVLNSAYALHMIDDGSGAGWLDNKVCVLIVPNAAVATTLTALLVP